MGSAPHLHVTQSGNNLVVSIFSFIAISPVAPLLRQTHCVEHVMFYAHAFAHAALLEGMGGFTHTLHTLRARTRRATTRYREQGRQCSRARKALVVQTALKVSWRCACGYQSVL